MMVFVPLLFLFFFIITNFKEVVSIWINETEQTLFSIDSVGSKSCIICEKLIENIDDIMQ